MVCKEIEIEGRDEPVCVENARELTDAISRIAREEFGYGSFVVYDISGPGAMIGQLTPDQIVDGFERIMKLSVKPYNKAAMGQ